MKSNWCTQTGVGAKLVLVLAVAVVAASVGSAAAKEPHKKHKSPFENPQMLQGIEHFNRHVQKVGKPTQSYPQPHGTKPYLNPHGSSDHPPLASGWWLGVSTHDYGHGPEVVYISHGSPASRIGLEQGDIIHEVDGIPVTTRWELSNAIRYSDGYVRLLIEDVRTGQYAYRMVRLARQTAYPY